MLRLIVNKARQHYNVGLEHAERGRIEEAIDELHNAIDLDRRFVSAHVVLGTLYAKRTEFDKAREAWNTALSIQPELSKAHNYLERVQTVQGALPALRVLRIAASVLAAATLLLAVALWFAKREDPSAVTLRAARDSYDSARYSTALTQLDQVKRKTPGDSVISIAAATLRRAIELDMRQQVRVIQELKFREDYPSALKLISQLEAHQPDIVTSTSLATIKEDINHYYRDRIIAMYNRFASGEVEYPELSERVQEYLRMYPDIVEKEYLRRYLDDARELEVAQQLDTIRDDFREKRDVPGALDAMQQLAARYPGTDALKKARPELVDEMLSWMFDRFQSLLGAQEFVEARSLLGEIQDLASEFRDIVDVSGPVELASRVLVDSERSDRIKEAERLVKAGRFDDAQGAIFDLLIDDELTTGERAVVFACQDRLDSGVLNARVQEIIDRKDDFLSLSISDGDATATLAVVDGLVSGLHRDDIEARTGLLACATAAALHLGEREKADEYLNRLDDIKGSDDLVSQLRKQMRKKRR
jgi:superkiller protein 3